MWLNMINVEVSDELINDHTCATTLGNFRDRFKVREISTSGDKVGGRPEAQIVLWHVIRRFRGS